MSSLIIKNLYIKSCTEELQVNKPGNHSDSSMILGMYSKKFIYASKISSNFMINKKKSLGEIIFLSTKKCIDCLNSNYNLGIILLCSPIIKAYLNKPKNFRMELRSIIKNINNQDTKLILKAIKYANPSGISNYRGKGSVFIQNSKNLSFSEIVKISSKWDRISKCYMNNYLEILEQGLPFFDDLKKKLPKKKAIQLLYMKFATQSVDSHILRKFGGCRASSIQKMFKMTFKKIYHNYKKNNSIEISNLDRYLKELHFNPGTCADLTVTTLLMDKIKDIFKYPL